MTIRRTGGRVPVVPPYLIRKCISMGRRIGDLINHARIFPLDSLRFFPRIMFNGLRSAIRGE